MTEEKKYILWDPQEGEPKRDEEGNITADGVMGRLTGDNVYLTTYATYAEPKMDEHGRKSCPARHDELEVGQWTEATFRLRGVHKDTYQIWRVQ